MADVEEILKGLGVPYAIIRPTLVFGDGDVLINNMAWALRRFPIFPLCGEGDYLVQPIHVEDTAEQAVAAAQESEDTISDSAGPETFTFAGLLRLLGLINGRALPDSRNASNARARPYAYCRLPQARCPAHP